MKLVEELLIFKASKDVENPFKFFSLAYLAIALSALGGGFIYGIVQNIQVQSNLSAISLGLVIAFILFILAFLSQLEAKKCIR